MNKEIYYKDCETNRFSTKEIYVHSDINDIMYKTYDFDTWDLPKYKYLMKEHGILYDSIRYLGRNLNYEIGYYKLDIFKETYTHISIEVI